MSQETVLEIIEKHPEGITSVAVQAVAGFSPNVTRKNLRVLRAHGEVLFENKRKPGTGVWQFVYYPKEKRSEGKE